MLAYDGSVYVLHIYDNAAAQLFFDNLVATGGYYDSSGNPILNSENHFADDTRLFEYYDYAYEKLYKEIWGYSKDDAHDAAMAYILRGSGVKLLKRMPEQEEFKQYDTETLTTPKGKVKGVKSTKCK